MTKKYIISYLKNNGFIQVKNKSDIDGKHKMFYVEVYSRSKRGWYYYFYNDNGQLLTFIHDIIYYEDIINQQIITYINLSKQHLKSFDTNQLNDIIQNFIN